MRRWIVVPIVLVIYGLVLYAVLTAFFYILFNEDGMDGVDFFEWWDGVSSDWDVVAPFGCTILGMMITQAILLWPVRKPWGGYVESGRPLLLSIPILALAAGFLTMGALLAGLELAISIGLSTEGSALDMVETIFFVAAGASWVIWTILIYIFMRGLNKESALRRWLGLLFAGSVIEAVLVIPLDIVVRRRTDCYCETGSFWSLYFCGGIGLWTLGPIALLMLLTRHRRPLYANSCPRCGYAKGPVRNRPKRCPECGVAWEKSEPGSKTTTP